jgi:hypothetical protein
MDVAIDKQYAHELLDQLDRGQLAAVVHLLEVMADPVARSLANAPVDRFAPAECVRYAFQRDTGAGDVVALTTSLDIRIGG